MRKRIAPIAIIFAALSVYGQGIFERFPFRPEKSSTLLLGYSGDLEIKGLGSGSLYFVPLDTNAQQRIVSIVTAEHNLRDKSTGIPFTGIIVKINAGEGSKPIYIKVPLKHDEPRNYWKSPSGFDLALIPLPPQLITAADVQSFTEDQLVTPESAKEYDVSSGLIVQALCIQPEYLDALDFLMPHTLPALRVGHLSRLGFYRMADGIQTIRPHVVDIHSSPGNSGATVLVLAPASDHSNTKPMFLGIIQGFPEETGSYLPFNAPVTNTSTETVNFLLVNADTSKTNQVALALKTIANPDLSTVIPVHELAGIRASQEYLTAVMIMAQNQSLYERYDAFPTSKTKDAQHAPPEGRGEAPRP